MCENPDIVGKAALQRLEHRLLAEYQKGNGRLEVDKRYAYFRGKAIPKEVWVAQAFEMGLPADMYLDIAALAKNEAGIHPVSHEGRTYLVEVNGDVQSEHGLHREVISITPYQSRN